MMSGRAAESTESDQKDTLYERDSYAWALEQALVLRERRVSALDWDNLAEELADLAARCEDSLKSYCRILVEHLLKLVRASKPARSNNLRLWTNSIKNARLQIADLLEAHPGIKSKAPELFAKAWRLGRNDALGALRLDDLAIPDECPWTFEEVCAENFWPVP